MSRTKRYAEEYYGEEDVDLTRGDEL